MRLQENEMTFRHHGGFWADKDLLGGRCRMDAFGSYIQNC